MISNEVKAVLLKLTPDELIRALANVGVDLECGKCADMFFMGLTYQDNHKDSCPKTLFINEIKKLQEKYDQAKERECICMEGLGI